jgi:ABC-type phosphate transport system substrate-binding protein
MKSLFARGVLPACILSAATVAAFIAPGAASATTVGKQCSSTAKVKGQGSTLQEEAELLWTAEFNVSGNKYACNGTQGEKHTPVVEYLHPGSGSGHALRSWDGELHGSPPKSEYVGPEPENAFLGTDEPPNRTQIGDIEKEETTITPESVETIPALEGAVAIIVNLPEGCAATSKSNAGRLVLNDASLEGIYRGTITKWSQLTENKDALSPLKLTVASVSTTSGSATVTAASFPGVKVGMKVTGTGIAAGTTVSSITSGTELVLSKNATKTGTATLTFTAASCNSAETIIPIVRHDGSGTTHIFKRYLNLVNSATFTDEEGKVVTWGEISEGGANTQWPTGVVTKEHNGSSACEGSGCMVTTVAETPSSIAYVNLADARSNGAFSKKSLQGGPKFQKFWVPIQNKEGEESYQDPASNKDVEAKASANCAGEEFSNGSAPFPPPSVTAPWDEVTTKLTEPKYPICGFTYVITLNAYSTFTVPTPTLEEATTVHDYLQFILNTEATAGKKGGQALIVNKDYLPLPKGEILTEAQNGANRVAF